MRIEIKRRNMTGPVLLPAIVLAIAVVLFGMAYRLEPWEDQPVLETVIESGAGPEIKPEILSGIESGIISGKVSADEDGEAAQLSLSPGEAAAERLSFRNRGRAGFRLRVKLCSAEINGKPVLQPGRFDGETNGGADSGSFALAMDPSTEPESGEYWTARGEYLYYRNTRTGDMLLPGRETPPAYSAVRLNSALDPEELETLELMGGTHQLFIVAQVMGEHSGEWQEPQNGPAGSDAELPGR